MLTSQLSYNHSTIVPSFQVVLLITLLIASNKNRVKVIINKICWILL